MPESSASVSARWNPVAAVAAWVLPGLGHFLLGQRRRGIILFACIGLLWTMGLLIGGISVIDRHRHPAWFLGQMLTAPSLAVSFYHDLIDRGRPVGPLPGRDPAYEPSFARVNEQGVLYTAVAGLLNLLTILDVLYRDPRDPRYRPDADADAEPEAAS